MLLQLLPDGMSFNDQIMAWVSAAFGPHAALALAIFKIIGINVLLSGDNAVVIALACRSLPAAQRSIGIALGALAAIVLRIGFTLVVQYLLDIPYLKLVGGLMLLWIAVKLLLSEEADEGSVESGKSLWEAVRIVAVADVIMSLDNVLAIAAAAHGNHVLVVIGLLISIPLVVFGSTVIMKLLNRLPVLVWAGAALLGWIGGELIAEEPHLSAQVHDVGARLALSHAAVVRLLEVAGAALVLLAGWMMKPKKHSHEL